MTESTAVLLRRLASVRGPRTRYRGTYWIIALLLRLVAVALLAVIGYIHLHLWQLGYRLIPTNGPLFLLDAVAAFVLGVALLAWPRPLIGLLAAGFTASTLGALVVSMSVGLFGLHESITGPFVVTSLVIESINVLLLLSWSLLTAARLSGAQPPPVRQGR